MQREQDGRQVLWAGNVLLLLRLSTTRNWNNEEFSYVQFMEVAKAILGVDRALGCVLLRLGTGVSSIEPYISTAICVTITLSREHFTVWCLSVQS